MNLNELYRAIPEDRELCLARNKNGIFFRIADHTTSKVVQVQEMIPGEQLLRAGTDIEKLFFDRLRTMNRHIDNRLQNENSQKLVS